MVLLTELKEVDTDKKLHAFEKKVDDYIMSKISKKEEVEKINKDYQDRNNSLLNINPNSLKGIIQGEYEPFIYSQETYPDIQYYTVSNIENYNYFVNKFNSKKENQNKYFLIHSLINKNYDNTQNLIALKNLEVINVLSNMLLLIYSFKIRREDAKKKLFKDEIENIIKSYNEINSIKIKDRNQFIEKFFKPFVKSWDEIKSKVLKFKHILLRDLKKGEKPLDMTIDLPLSFFLVDDGEKEGGMFLASAYENMIEWQNNFIDIIIRNNKLNGIHNSYVSQLEQEVDIQNATKEEIIKIDNEIYKSFKDLIHSTANRNIFSKDDKIYYKNYNDIEYNYEYIEEELGKLILPGIKKFKKETIKFVTYLYEGFRADNANILFTYNSKFPPKKLDDDEESRVEELLKSNPDVNFCGEIFSSLQILMNEIVKENYEPNYFIYNVIDNLPEYIILNQDLKTMFKGNSEYFMDEPKFSINTLVSIFEYLEDLCWKEIKENIMPNYKLKIPEKAKKYITEYFNSNKEEKIINAEIFTRALRKLISRLLAGSRQEIDMDSKTELILFIYKVDLWNHDFYKEINMELFTKEILCICQKDFTIGNCLDLYNSLDGDNFLNDILDKKKGEIDENKEEAILENNQGDNDYDSEGEEKEKDNEEQKSETEEEEVDDEREL